MHRLCVLRATARCQISASTPLLASRPLATLSTTEDHDENDFHDHYARQHLPLQARYFATRQTPARCDYQKDSRRWLTAVASQSDEIDDDDVQTSSEKSESSGSDASAANIKSKKRRKRLSMRLNRRRKQLEQQQKKANTAQPKKIPNDAVLRYQLEQLFDEIAPLVSVLNLENFLVLLQGATSQKMQKIIDKSPLLQGDNGDYSNDPDEWMQSKILAFLDILPLHARSIQTVPSPIQYRLETSRFEAMSKLLQEARQKSLSNSEPIFWSSSNAGPSLETRLGWYQEKSNKELRQDARDFARLLAERLPPKQYEALTILLENYTGTGNQHARKSPQKKDKRNIKNLFNNVAVKTGLHVHFIVAELAQFFFFDAPKSMEPVSGDDSENKAEKIIKKGIAKKSITETEIRVQDAQEKWRKYRERFVKKCIFLYKKIHTPDSISPDKLRIMRRKRDDDEVATMESSHEFDKIEEDQSKEEEEEILAKIVSDNLQLGKEAKKADNKKSQQRSPEENSRRVLKSKVHLIYDAVVVDSQREREKVYAMTSDTTVFLDNLPIDTTESELKTLYGRCGSLEHVEVFNLRADLDPGPIPGYKLLARAQKQRKQRSRQNRSGRWTRPRTPVYAMLSFEDQKACLVASQDSLRIFGMIIRGHSVRSLRSRDLTRLYIDNMVGSGGIEDKASHLSSMDIEYRLSQLLNPDLYICLDISSSSHRHSKRVMPGSCEIMFPTFEIAYEAFCTLRQGLDLVQDQEECTINWLPTPPDAMKYWKRELGGVV